MGNTELISVIIPTYNRAHIIKRSVDSVLNQTYKNLELIIVDDGSTDNTKEIIDLIKDERIVYIKQKNQGASAARNTGIEKAKGKYIAFNDSDDVWHLNKLEKQIQALQENNADVVFCKMFAFGNLIKRIVPNNFKEGFLNKKEIPLGISTQELFGKASIFKNNLFNINATPIEDFELSLRIQKFFSIYCLNEPLIDYYIQKDSISNNSLLKLKSLKMILNNNKNFLKEYSNSSKERLAEVFLNYSFQIKDYAFRKQSINLIFTISKSKNIRIKYFFHKLYVYKLKTLIYKTASKSIKFLIKLIKA